MAVVLGASPLFALSRGWQVNTRSFFGSVMLKLGIFSVLAISLSGGLFVSSCATSVPHRQPALHSPSTTAAPPPPPPTTTTSPSPPPTSAPTSSTKEDDTTVQVGEASWYGARFHGQETSTGEKYNQNNLTAAHPTLPEGSKVKVTNMENGKSVKVRVNDRGPYVDDRIIDVSRKAAKTLDMVEEGTAEVKVEVISKPTKKPTKKTNDSQQK